MAKIVDCDLDFQLRSLCVPWFQTCEGKKTGLRMQLLFVPFSNLTSARFSKVSVDESNAIDRGSCIPNKINVVSRSRIKTFHLSGLFWISNIWLIISASTDFFSDIFSPNWITYDFEGEIMRRFLKRLLLKSLNQTDAILNSFKLFYTLYFAHFIWVITFINPYQGKN